jgi:hypothetical protein
MAKVQVSSVDPDEPPTKEEEERSAAVTARQVARARHRSPNYPFINLERAIERAKQIYEPDKRHDVPIAVASKNRWDYKYPGSQCDQTVAALKAYGLVDVNGVGDGRTIRISDRAYRILAGAQDAPERIKDAALAPVIHAELWQKYSSQGIPANDLIRHYLLFDRENGTFNDDVVDGVIERFKDTISFAKLIEGDKIGEVDVQPKDGDNDKTAKDGLPSIFDRIFKPVIQPLKPDVLRKPEMQQPELNHDTFTVPEGPVDWRWPSNIGRASFQDIKDWVMLQLRKMERSIPKDAPEENKDQQH